ncbi:MAG: secretin N-terminal domain-containing protein [Bdellovibrionales bacterium]
MAVILALSTALSGCDTEKTRNLIDQRAGEAQDTLLQARSAQPSAKRYNPLVVTDKVYAGNAAMRMHRGLPLPTRYETAQGITVISGQPLSLNEIAASIGSQTGIPVRVSDPMRIEPPAPPPQPTIPGRPIVGSPGFANQNNNTNNNQNNSSSPGMPVSYEGPLSGLLERVAGFFSVNWRYDGTSITISRFETRVFMIEALPETANMTDSSQTSSTSGSAGGASGGSSGGTSGGSSSSGGNTSTGTLTQNVNYTGSIKYWEELKDTLSAILGGNGNVITSPSSGEVTITTTPEIMRQVSEYISQANKRLSRQIAINVEVYSVDLARDSDFNASFSALLGRIDNAATIDFVGPSAPSSIGSLSGLGSLSVGIINPKNGPKITDIFNALSSIGDTTSVAQFPMTTINNRPVSRFVGTTEYFVPQITSNTLVSTSSSSSTSATAQPITSGLTLQLVPRLLDDGRIIMQYSLNIQTIVSIQPFNVCTGQTTAGSSSTGSGCVIQEPVTTNRSFIQQSVLRSGSTLVIGGVDQENVAQNAQGVGSPFNWLLGGGSSNQTGRTMVFIAITPQVLDPPAAEQGL